MLVSASEMPLSVALLGLCARPSAEPIDKTYLLQTSQLYPLIGEKVEAFRNYATSQCIQSLNSIHRVFIQRLLWAGLF